MANFFFFFFLTRHNIALHRKLLVTESSFDKADKTNLGSSRRGTWKQKLVSESNDNLIFYFFPESHSCFMFYFFHIHSYFIIEY